MNFFTSLSEYVNDNLVAPVPARSDKLIRERQSLLVALKICAGKVIKAAGQAGESGVVDSASFQCGALISAVERVIFHGIKVREFHGTFPFWGLLQRMNSVYPPLPDFAGSTSAVAAACETLRSPLALSRGWVREALNLRCLCACMEAIEQQPQLGFFFEEGSLLLDPGCFKIMVSILRSIELLNFNLTVCEEELNEVPAWLLVSFSESPAKGKALNKPARRYSSPATVKAAEAPATTQTLQRSDSRWDSIYDVVGTKHAPDGHGTDTSAYLPRSDSRRSKQKDVFARTKLFGTSLKELILDDRRCKYALLDSHIGIPRQVHNMISVLHRAIDLPGLFRCRGSREELMVLRDALEAEQDIPAGTQIYTVAHCLLQWLYELPEPILCYEHFESFLICNSIETLSDRIRNFQLLVDQVSWWQVPLLVQVVNLFATALMPSHASKNGLSLSAVVVMTTPFLLRSPKFGAICPRQNQPPSAVVLGEIEAACMAISVIAGPSVEFLFNNQLTILEEIRATYEHHVAWLEDKLERLEFVQKFAATHRLLVSDVSAYLDEHKLLPNELIFEKLSAADGEAAGAVEHSSVRPRGEEPFHLNAVGVRVTSPPSLADEDNALVDSLTVISSLWQQLEGAHRQMLEKHWRVYAGPLPTMGLAEGAMLESDALSGVKAQSSRDMILLDDESEDDSSDGDSSNGNRVSVAKRRKSHQRHVSAGMGSDDESDDLLGGGYDHVRSEIDGMVRMSHSEGNLQEISVSPSGSVDGGSDDGDSRARSKDMDFNPAGKYDGEDKNQAKFHQVVPRVILESENRKKRRDSEDSQEGELSDPDVVVVKEKKAIVVSGQEGRDEGWGDRGKKFGGFSVLQKGNSFFSSSTRDAVRFEAYLNDTDEEKIDRDRVDAAREWKPTAVDAPVVFPAYDMSKLLAHKSIEAYRWSICGFAGCPSSEDRPEREEEVKFGASDTVHTDSASLSTPLVSFSDGAVEAPQRSVSPQPLRRHGNHQRPLRPQNANTARREEENKPLQIFEDHEFGAIAAELLLRFLQRFGHRADTIVCEYARNRIKYCSLSVVSCRLTQIVLWVLRLVPSSKPSHHSYGMRSASSNNNVSELNSFFREGATASSSVHRRDASPNEQIDETAESSSHSVEYENKIFECSNTYNVIESDVNNTSEGVSETAVQAHAVVAVETETGADDVEKSDLDEDANFLMDDPVEIDVNGSDDEGGAEDSSFGAVDAPADRDSGVEGESDDLFDPSGWAGKQSFSKQFSASSSLSASARSVMSIQILPPKMLAQEPSWAILSSEKCIQEVFDIAMLMFEDIWKYTESTEACGLHYDSEEVPQYTNNSGSLKELLQLCSGSGSTAIHFDPFNFCLDVVKSLMSELIDMRLMSVDQLWNQWTLLRMGRQELVFESKLLLKLSRLSLLRQSIESAEEGNSPSDSGYKKFSVLSSLSSLLGPAGEKRGLPQSNSTGSLPGKGADDSGSKELPALYLTQHELYAKGAKETRDPTPPLHIFGDSHILTTRQLKELRHKLPEQYKFADWHLRYRMASDGASLTTMLKLSPDDETKLLVFLNSVGDVFGALVTDVWSKKLTHHFYGTGTCSVWSFYQGEELQLYRGTGTNDYYILVCEQYFAMGSGGNFAIYLDSDLSNGCSGPCETYGSPSLCTSEEFSCVACEVYSLQSNI